MYGLHALYVAELQTFTLKLFYHLSRYNNLIITMFSRFLKPESAKLDRLIYKYKIRIKKI
jgi:hypothetical protein